MVGVLLGTFARDGSAEEDMRRPGCKRQAEIGSICNALGVSNVWVWLRMRNLQDGQFTRPHVPLVRGSCLVLVRTLLKHCLATAYVVTRVHAGWLKVAEDRTKEAIAIVQDLEEAEAADGVARTLLEEGFRRADVGAPRDLMLQVRSSVCTCQLWRFCVNPLHPCSCPDCPVGTGTMGCHTGTLPNNIPTPHPKARHWQPSRNSTVRTS